MIISAVLLAVVLVLFVCSPSRVAPAVPLNALLQVITPCSSSWPRKYRSLTKSSSYLRLPLSFIIQDVLAGDIEICSPNETLQRILSQNGQLQIKTWRVFLSYGTLWPVIVYRCVHLYRASQPPRLVPIPDSQEPVMMTPKIAQSPVSAALEHTPKSLLHGGADDQSITRAIAVLPVLLPTFASHILRKLAVAAMLDTTPYAHLDTALLDLQSSIPTGHLALLEFTTCESITSIWSTAWLLSVLPFIHPSVHRPNIYQRPTGVPPLRNKLPNIITLLESGTHPCTVLSIQNVSALQAQLLTDYARNLEMGAGRRRFLARFSDRALALRAWRGEVFWARWEAACYACGNITRWVICIKRPVPERHNEW